MAETWWDDLGERLTAATSILTLGVGLFALFLGYDWFWMVFVLGWAVVTPLVAILSGSDASEDEALGTGAVTTRESTRGDAEEASKQDALETLRDRYARGELSEEEFEGKLEQLLRTETLEDARRTVEENRARSADREREGESARERDGEPARDRDA